MQIHLLHLELSVRGYLNIIYIIINNIFLYDFLYVFSKRIVFKPKKNKKIEYWKNKLLIMKTFFSS